MYEAELREFHEYTTQDSENIDAGAFVLAFRKGLPIIRVLRR